ncbi:MAG: DUF6057 family protein [Tannerellaceae bacterium]|jgi:hypothetical protein|nr:DUF6057 family protein [Tannerellaceae bacterium]
MKYRLFVFAFLLFAALFVWLEWVYRFHFFYIEQNQMFLFASHYFTEMVGEPGGVANYVGEFLVQFFVRPYAGAFITAMLLTLTGVLTALICKRMAPGRPLYFLYALPPIALLCVHFAFNYIYQGTVAFMMMLAAYCLYISLRRFRERLAVGAVSVLLLYWWGGAVALPFAFCAVLWEGINRTPKGYWVLLLVAEAVAAAWVSVYLCIVGDVRFAFLPDMYYHHGLQPGKEIYYAWISFPAVLLAARFFGRKGSSVLSAGREIVWTTGQLLLVAMVSWAGVSAHIDRKSAHLKMLDHYARTGQWDTIIAHSGGQITNYLYLNYLNLALAEKGTLADEFFKYDQRGINGLFIPWNKTVQPSIILSDIHFKIGNIAIAQEMAFEAMVSTPGYGSPRLLMRLIQTNLVYGAYPVAEKYVDMLENTLFYRDRAKEYRKFLYNDERLERDTLLASRRKGLVAENYITNSAAASVDLPAIALQNPEDRTAIEYFGCAILLLKDMQAFEAFLTRYYGTEVLPALPVSFQEAVITLHENQPEMWEHYRIPQAMVERFGEYKKQVLAHRNNSGAANLLRRSYGDSYWFYYMFK